MSLRALTAVIAAACCIHPAPAATVVISQQGRAFNPASIEIAVGDTLRIVNDDADLLHHSYLRNEAFTFDSGDQEPGTSYDVVFPVAGEFDVLCGIHPKMKLRVTVR